MSKPKTQSQESVATEPPAPTEAAATETPPPSSEQAAGGGQETAKAPSPSGPAEELAELKAKAAQASQLQDQWLRAVADLENFRKRAARERAEAVRYANESLLQKLVPVLDNFEAAVAAASAPNATPQSILTGVTMIHQQLKAALAEAGLEEIDATGAMFDPRLHEAVAHEDAAGVPEGQVTRQLRRGYRLKDRLLRPATVAVATGTPAAAAS